MTVQNNDFYDKCDTLDNFEIFDNRDNGDNHDTLYICDNRDSRDNLDNLDSLDSLESQGSLESMESLSRDPRWWSSIEEPPLLQDGVMSLEVDESPLTTGCPRCKSTAHYTERFSEAGNPNYMCADCHLEIPYIHLFV
jgi:hypothetical protein